MTLPSAPSSSDPTNFESEADSFLSALPQFETDMNALAAAMTLNSVNDTSSTSNTIASSGSLTFTVSSSKSFVGGMYLNIADAAAPSTNLMTVIVTSYSGTTLIVKPIYKRGSGTKSSWVISMAADPQTIVEDSDVYLATANGHGSTNNKIMRMATTLRDVGTAIDYLDDATNGATFTINKTALYSITFSDSRTGGATSFGVSVNSSQLTTAIASITAADRVLYVATNAAGAVGNASTTIKLTSGDVLRMHTDGSAGGPAPNSYFRITLVGNVS